MRLLEAAAPFFIAAVFSPAIETRRALTFINFITSTPVQAPPHGHFVPLLLRISAI
jgi:hypothetical protein